MILSLFDFLIFGSDIHVLTLDNLAFRSANNWSLHVHNLTHVIEENGRGRFNDTWHERVLNELEVELLSGVVAENSAVVRQVNLEIVCHTESLSEHALGHQGVHIVVITGVVSKEACTLWTSSLRGDLELENHRLLFSGSRQDKCLLAMSSLHRILAPILVQLDLRLVRDDQVASVRAHSIVDVYRKVSHFTSKIEVL